MGAYSTSERLLALLKDLGPIHGRKALQKKVYFAQVLGLELGYGYKWYMYGPYSQDLTDEIDFFMSVKEVVMDKENNIHVRTKEPSQFSSPEQQSIERLKELTEEMKPYQLELMATIHFFINEVKCTEGKDVIFAMIEKEKPGKFIEKDMEDMWKRLECFGLIK